MSALKTLIAVLLVVSPASIGIASYTGALDLGLGAAEPSSFGGEVVAEWEQELSDETTGELDLRIDRGVVRVIGWERNAYHVMVVQAPSEEATASDRTTEAELTDSSREGHLNLSVVVDRKGAYHVDAGTDGVRTGESRVDRAIIAYVPASLDYERVFACSGQAHALSQTVSDALPDPVRVGWGGEDCVPQEEAYESTGRINMMGSRGDDESLNVTFGLEGLSGQKALLDTDFSDVDVANATFQHLALDVDHGDVALTTVEADRAVIDVDHGDVLFEGVVDELDIEADHGEVEARGFDASRVTIDADHGDVTLEGDADKLSVEVDHGDIELFGTAASAVLDADYGDILVEGALDEADVEADHGDVTLAIDPRTSGALEVDLDYGDLTVAVPARGDLGYHVDAETDHGEIVVALQDASVHQKDQDDRHEEHVVARTNGFDERPVQLRLDLVVDHGDIEVSDGSDPVTTEDRDDDEEEHENEPSDPSPDPVTVDPAPGMLS